MYSAILVATFITVQQLICDSSQLVDNHPLVDFMTQKRLKRLLWCRLNCDANVMKVLMKPPDLHFQFPLNTPVIIFKGVLCY